MTPLCHAERSEASMSGFLACARNDKRQVQNSAAKPTLIRQHELKPLNVLSVRQVARLAGHARNERL